MVPSRYCQTTAPIFPTHSPCWLDLMAAGIQQHLEGHMFLFFPPSPTFRLCLKMENIGWIGLRCCRCQIAHRIMGQYSVHFILLKNSGTKNLQTCLMLSQILGPYVSVLPPQFWQWFCRISDQDMSGIEHGAFC